jgi:hypothetical protein
MASCFNNNKTDTESDYLKNKKVKTIYCASRCNTQDYNNCNTKKISNIYPAQGDYLNNKDSTYLQNPNWIKIPWNDLEINLITEINIPNIVVDISYAGVNYIDPSNVLFGDCTNTNINFYRQYIPGFTPTPYIDNSHQTCASTK